MTSILSDIFYINNNDNIDNEQIENELSCAFGDVIRWAIVDIIDNKLKIIVTYETEAFTGSGLDNKL